MAEWFEDESIWRDSFEFSFDSATLKAGEQEVENALKHGAVEYLLVTDVMVRSENGEKLLTLARQTNSDFYKDEVSKAGYIAKEEKYLFFRNRQKENKINTEVIDKNDQFSIEIAHLRILWIFISIMIMFFYLSKKYKERKGKKNTEV